MTGVVEGIDNLLAIFVDVVGWGDGIILIGCYFGVVVADEVIDVGGGGETDGTDDADAGGMAG